MRSRIPFCATLSASSTSASEISSDPPSTITMESAEPLTTRSIVENSSCWKVGLRIQLFSTRPTRTAARGPFHGTTERLSAAAAAMTPRMSASFSWSAESTVTKTCTSFLNPSGNSGRIERSMRRLARISLSDGRPSRLRNPPGILPAAYVFSRYSTVRGKNGREEVLGETVTAAKTIVSPNRSVAEPAACLASRPVSIVSGRPANWVSIRCTVTTFSLCSLCGGRLFRVCKTRQGVPIGGIRTPLAAHDD